MAPKIDVFERNNRVQNASFFSLCELRLGDIREVQKCPHPTLDSNERVDSVLLANQPQNRQVKYGISSL
jgi:hypothetical protein